MNLVTALGLAAVSGLLYALSFPPPGLAWLVWVSLVPFMVGLWGARTGRAVALAVVWTTVATYGVGRCLPGAVESYYRQSAALGWLLLVIVMLVTAIPWYALFAVAFARLSRAYARTLPLLAGAAWAAAELGRIRGLVGNPWGVSGYSQAAVLPIAQVADLGGVLAISFLIATVNAAIAQLWVRRRERRGALGGAGAVAALLVAAFLYGAVRLAQFPPEDEDTVRVAIIQPNIDLGSVWFAELYGRNLREYLAMTREAVSSTQASLVFWPETAMTFFIESEPDYRAALGSVLGGLGVELMAGGVHQGGTRGAPHYHNSIYLVRSDGEVAGRYDKLRLLPFAEYFPLSVLDFARRDFGQVREFAPGSPTPPLATRAGQAAPLVCNEAFFGHLASERTRDGAELLVNPANDSWMSDPAYALQAFQMVRLRAIEQRRDLVRTSTSGPSAVIDPAGRVEEATGPDSRAWVDGAVKARHTRTVYQQLGDLFGLACAAVVIAAVLRARSAQNP